MNPTEIATAEIVENAERAAAFLKTLANPNRLTLLCILSQGEYNVSDLEDMLGIRQPTLSQQLAVLREEGLVTARRDGKAIYYRLVSPEAKEVIDLLYKLYCEQPGNRTSRAQVAKA